MGGKYQLEYWYGGDLIGTNPELHIQNNDGTSTVMKGVPIYPGVREDYGEDLVLQHYNNFSSDLMVFFGDVWALQTIPQLANQGQMTWLCYSAMDWVEPTHRYVLDKMASALKVVPWVRNAYDRLAKLTDWRETGKLVEPIPIGISKEMWKPLDRTEFPQTMQSLGFREETYNILIVSANQFLRKAWAETLEGIRVFKQYIPDIPIRLYVHSFLQSGGEWDLKELINSNGLADDARAPDPYTMLNNGYDETDMVKIFNCADVIVNCGLEGFGMATLEAQACDKPVIGLDATSTSELLAKGVKVPVRWEQQTPPMLRRAYPDANDIAEALRIIADTPKSKWKDASSWVYENYSWDVVMPKWLKLLNDVEEELDRKCLLKRSYPPKPTGRLLERADTPRVID